jgi:hypothetical protein
MITRLMTSDCSSIDAGHKVRYQPTFRFLFCRSCLSTEILGISAAELIGETHVREKRSGERFARSRGSDALLPQVRYTITLKLIFSTLAIQQIGFSSKHANDCRFNGCWEDNK